jgi:uncharacterized protein with HEPN domain
MTRHDDKVRLRHMLDHAREAVAMIEGKERSDLFQQRLLELALTRLVEIIGEAAAKVSPEAQDRYTLIPWREVVGMRNRLVHGFKHRLECFVGYNRG